MHYNNLPVIVKRLSGHNDGDYNHCGENYGRLPARKHRCVQQRNGNMFILYYCNYAENEHTVIASILILRPSAEITSY